jgi:hypothetical protein
MNFHKMAVETRLHLSVGHHFRTIGVEYNLDSATGSRVRPSARNIQQ